MLPEEEKIIAFELDFLRCRKYYSDEELNNLFNLLKDLGVYSNLFLFTNNSLQQSINFLREQELNIGYLISNSGSCVYNLITNKKEKEKTLGKEVLEPILRFSFFNDLIFIAHYSNQSFIYGFDYLTPEKQEIYSHFSQLKNLWEIKEVINSNSVYSLEILFEESNSELRFLKINNFLNSFKDLKVEINHLVVDPIIYLFPKNNSKLQIISEVIGEHQAEISSNLIYSSWATPDLELAESSFFWLSLSEFSSWIDKELPHKSVIFLDNNSQVWIDWWRDQDYLWRENLLKLNWISRKISRLETTIEEDKDNCFELDLIRGSFRSKEINERLNSWALFQWKSFLEQKEGLVTIFLWPEQLKNLLATKNLGN